jgi:two-component system, LytTR family, response regulator
VVIPASAGLRVVVVDDEALARSSVVTLLRRDPDVASIVECDSGRAALGLVRRDKPDLLYLDVQMPECDGFDVIELLGRDAPPVVIFVTAYDEYALRAFEAGVLDYLLKPFDDARFDLSLARAKERLGQLTQSRAREPERLIVKNAGQVWFVRVEEIDWIEAADYYVCLHVGPKRHLLRRSLSDLEESLAPDAFCRIHRSTLVNLNRVNGIEFDTAGEYEVLLRGDLRLKLSRRYRKELEARLSQRTGR